MRGKEMREALLCVCCASSSRKSTLTSTATLAIETTSFDSGKCVSASKQICIKNEDRLYLCTVMAGFGGSTKLQTASLSDQTLVQKSTNCSQTGHVQFLSCH